MNQPPRDPRASADPPAPVAHLELKAALLVLAMLLLLAGAVLYLLYARGAFERTQELVLIADDSEGVSVGMDMTFSGFPIGRVRRIELAADGSVRIVVDVPVKDAGWLRSSSVFVLSRGLVGGTSLRAYSGVLDDPPLPAGAERRVIAGDATAEIPQLLAGVRELVGRLGALVAPDAALAASLGDVRRLTERLNGPGGALGVALGDAQQAQRLVARLEGAAARADALLARIDGVVARADERVLGPDGMLRELQGSAAELRALLADTRASLGKVDAVLEQARGIAGDVRGATTDLDVLRADVEASLRRVDRLIGEINRRWPFARDTELRLP
ncbi:MlaD family protein [Azohydromonas sp.]|uniref:MlaD family protein n=1 Tax=Azohydromonas sp. TaxID=1872666 RepID=UPI002C5EA8C2|nr:MlaD family protein [Azohydromonas sp.]HMM86073.1 MlaD family protein [Azohydromonas sp.]